MAKINQLTGEEIIEETPIGNSPVTTDLEGKLSTGFSPLREITPVKEASVPDSSLLGGKGLEEEIIEETPLIGSDFIVDIDEESEGDVPALEFTEDGIVDIFSKKESERSDAEKAQIRKFNAKKAFNLIKGLDAFGNKIGGEVEAGTVDTTGLDTEAEANIKAIQDASATALTGKQEDVDLRLAQAKTDIEQRGKNRMTTLDRGLSFSGFGRSSTAVQKRDELQSSINSEIRQAQAKADLEVQLFKAQQASADGETISAIRKQLADTSATLKETETENAIALAEANQELGLKADEALDSFLNGTAQGLEAKDKGFDKDASLALGYISDKFGNPLVDDVNGDPIAFTGNELGQDVKISNFKDGNDNTYVYKNGVLDSIIQNDGTILSGDEVKTAKVPASVTSSKSTKDRIDLEQKLRKEFNASDQIDTFAKIKSSFQRVNAGVEANSAAGDLALIFSFMKMLDPGSVVREGEFATAQNAAGIPDQVRNLYNKAQTGERLNEKQRVDFLGRSKDIFDKELSNAKTVRDQFVRIADDAGATSDFITGAFDELTTIDEGATFEADEEDEIKGAFSLPADSTESTFKGSSGTEFNIPADTSGLTSGEPTSVTNSKVSGILGDLNNQVTVVEKGGDNPVLGLSGGSLTYRTNNPLAITATGAGTAERLTNKFNSIPDLFSPDSADNLVLNFRTPEEGLQAGVQLLESKGDLTIDKLMESHTGTSAPGHKAQATKLGLNLNTKFKDLSPEDKLKVVEAIKIGEGFKEGTIIS